MLASLPAYFVETREREPVLGACVSGVEAFVCINLQMKTGRLALRRGNLSSDPSP